ncbi:MAG TPA: hypothetical protein VFY18_13495 [Candidatus Limnocylindrales bacterium]|nr:hypothetical protein [Candidatus Limnocylindrales bacterium]
MNPDSRARIVRAVLATVFGLELAWIAFVLVQQWQTNPTFGLDYRWHVDAARRLLDTGTPYWPWQIAGPYEISDGAILYPPTAFLLFIPFIWLPAVLWWAVPIAILAVGMAIHRPPLWAWVVIGAILSFEKSLNVFVFGNPSMWIVAAIAAGTVLWWPFILVVAKPTFAPIALIGIRHRSWWIAAAILAVASIPFARVWLDWLAVVRNSNVSLIYNLPTLPLMLAPLVAWLAGVRRPLEWPKPRPQRDEVPPQVVG